MGAFISIGFGNLYRKNQPISNNSLIPEVPISLEAVAALGRLEPYGDVRRLAAPITGFGGTPRILSLHAQEGDLIKEGELLAVFDNRPSVLADIDAIKARLRSLELEIALQKKEISRYQAAVLEGATALVLLENKEDELIRLEGQKDIAIAEQGGLNVDLVNTELRAPMDCLVLRVHSRVGERPGEDGVFEIGSNKSMEALIEVYESDVDRVKVGQLVTLTSENGGFKGILEGRVERISPQVRQRKVLSTDPTGDADARVVEVRVSLDPEYVRRVSRLTGMKVIARFQP